MCVSPGPDRSVVSRTHGPILAVVAAVMVATAVSWSPAEARGGKERLDRVERAVIRILNHRRSAAGKPRVRPSRALARAADFHSWEMLRANYFAHASASGA